MSNKVKDINIINLTYYFFNAIVNLKKFDSNNIKVAIQKALQKYPILYYSGYVTIKDSKYVKIYSVNPLYFIFNKVIVYFEEINGSKYLTLVPPNEGKGKKYEELRSKIKDLIKSITKNLKKIKYI